MERKYIFHHTGKGFLLFLAGLLFLFGTCIFLVFNFPDSKFMNYGIFSFLAFCIIFMSFKVDKTALNNRDKGH